MINFVMVLKMDKQEYMQIKTGFIKNFINRLWRVKSKFKPISLIELKNSELNSILIGW